MTTRRSFLKSSALTAAGAMALGRTMRASALWQNQEAATGTPSIVQTMRNAGAITPIKTTKLTDTIFLLQGVGGNVVAHTGPDGKLLVDSSVATAAHAILMTLEKMDAHSLKLLINTHWHFDHTDGNAALHDAGAFIIAQENTRLRLSTPQQLKALNYSFPAAPNSGLPQQTFAESENLYFDNGEIDLIHAPNAHTDSDIFVHFVNGNVIHTGDLWFNNVYPLIDDGTGGTINGMLRGVDQVLLLADDKTKIVPGHGPLGDKTALNTYREMLATVANRVNKLKIAGQPLDQVIAAKPTADLDSVWGHGSIKPDLFVTLVYNTL